MRLYITAFLITLSSNSFASKVSLDDAFTLADVMYCEARNQDRIGMLAVADVVLNRVRSKRFPNTVYEVVNQAWQFECIERKTPINEDSKDYRNALKLAIEVLNGNTPRITYADHYHASWMQSYPRWTKSGQIAKLGTIGDHIFYAYK